MTSNQIQYANYVEGSRHNQAEEAETNRANLARETETSKHNRATEKQARNELSETRRHYLATETEANRTNLANERLKSESNQVSYATGMSNAAAHVTAAQIAAAASKYASDMNAQIAQWNKAIDKEIARGNNESAEKIQKAKDFANAVQKALDRAQQDKHFNLEHALNKAKIKIDKAYKDKEIRLKEYDLMLRALTEILPNLGSAIGQAAAIAGG